MPARAAGEDLHDTCGKPDQDPSLPRPVVGAGHVENEPAAKRAERRADLVQDKRNAEQGRHVAGAEHLGDEAARSPEIAQPLGEMVQVLAEPDAVMGGGVGADEVCADASVSTSRRQFPLPCLTRIDPRRRCRSVSVSDSASCFAARLAGAQRAGR